MEAIKRYRENNGINHSYLKTFLNPYKKERQEYSKHKFTKGNLLDVLVTLPNEFDNIFYISNISKPSENILKIIDYVYNIFKETPDIQLESLEDYIIQGADKYKYGWKKDNSERQWAEATIVNKVITQGNDYWQELIQSNNREVVTVEEVDLAQRLVNSLYTHPLTCNLFEQELELQKDIYWDWEINNNIYPCKGLLDIYHVTENTGRVIDIKATDVSPWEVDNIIKRLRYDFQVVFYTEGLKILESELNILPPRIIFCHNNFPEHITVVEISDEDYDIALNGSIFNKIDTNKQPLYVKRKRKVLGIVDAFELMDKSYQQKIIYSNLW